MSNTAENPAGGDASPDATAYANSPRQPQRQRQRHLPESSGSTISRLERDEGSAAHTIKFLDALPADLPSPEQLTSTLEQCLDTTSAPPTRTSGVVQSYDSGDSVRQKDPHPLQAATDDSLQEFNPQSPSLSKSSNSSEQTVRPTTQDASADFPPPLAILSHRPPTSERVEFTLPYNGSTDDDSSSLLTSSEKPSQETNHTVTKDEQDEKFTSPVFDQVQELINNAVWWRFAYISHNSRNINHSHYVWYNNAFEISRPFIMEGTNIVQPTFTCTGNTKNKAMSELLNAFCQQIELPHPLPDNLYAAAGLIATVMCAQHDGTKFKRSDLPFGLKGITPVNQLKQIQLLSKKTNMEEVILQDYNGQVRLHKDEGMLDRGLVNCSVLGAPSETEFGFMVIVNIKDDDFRNSFNDYPSPAFDIVLASACFIFYRALSYIKTPANHTEAAVLARRIGRGMYEECTKEIDPEEAVGLKSTEEDTREDKADEGRIEASTSGPSKSKKRKPKKGKKGRANVAEGEACVAVEDPLPTITVSPPTPEPESKLAVAVAPPPTARSPVLSLPLPLPLVTSTSFSRPVFSFLSSDPRLTCRLPGCNTLANASLASAVVCPRCTAWSFTRYCCRSHLQRDVRAHFASGVCGTTPVLTAVDDDETSLPPSALPLRPYIQETYVGSFPKNIVERHRQALYRSMSPDVAVDYYVFDDIDHVALPADLLRTAPPHVKKEYLQPVRATGTVCAAVVLPWVDARKQRFDLAVDGCLRLGCAAGAIKWDDCLFTFDVIKDVLKRAGRWDARMEERVAVQMGFEFGWRLPIGMRDF